MTTHLIIAKDQITNFVSVGTGAFPKRSADGSPYFVYITAIISGIPLIESRVFVWGDTPGESVSPKMIEHATKAHLRVLPIILFYCAWLTPCSLLIDPSDIQNLSKPLLFKS